MPPDDLVFVGHMVDMARIAQQLIAGVRREQLDMDVKLQLALVRALQLIGEAAWRISQPFKDRRRALPWRQIAPFRHRVVHGYFAVDYDIVWRIASSELQPLIDQLGPLLPPAP
jgi:uncharacterized protein with HEPN domain